MAPEWLKDPDQDFGGIFGAAELTREMLKVSVNYLPAKTEPAYFECTLKIEFKETFNG